MWPRDKIRRVGHLEYIIAADVLVEHFTLLRVRVVTDSDDSERLILKKFENR